MKAIVQDRYGPPELLELRDIDQPVPAAGEVLVRVHAAAVNAYDWHVMRGDPYPARFMAPAVFGRRGPKRTIRGRDFAGRVAAVGSGVTRLRPGDEVYGEADGTFAEYVCVPADLAEPKPANLTFAQAAAIPLAGNTALMGLRDVGGVQAGQRVLVNGASGGVGTFAVQLARALGAHVTGVCSTRNVELVRSTGADDVIDYARDDFTRTGQRYDLVFDLVGNRSLTDCRRALTPTGTLVLSGGGVSKGVSLRRAARPHHQGAAAVAVGPPATAGAHRTAERAESGDAAGVRRIREAHAGHRPDLRAARGTRRHPVRRGGARARQGRHHGVSGSPQPAVVSAASPATTSTGELP